jgi:hypothetical protein
MRKLLSPALERFVCPAELLFRSLARLEDALGIL